MNDTLDRLKPVLADRYAIEHELGAGGMELLISQNERGYTQ